ncbi:MAG: hypothetical protein R3D33_08300 [Hyphomicrobiaceae bacterium]
MRNRFRPLCARLIPYLIVALCPTDDGPISSFAAELPKVVIGSDPAILPEAVAEMREAILEAARSGDLEALRIPIEMNEIPPVIGPPDAGRDPLLWWRKVSADGEGREVMAALTLILEAGYAHVDPDGPREMYVWPYLAAVPLGELTPRQSIDLHRIAKGAEAEAMTASGVYSGWRLGIGADGVWHYMETGSAAVGGGSRSASEATPQP